MWTTNKEETSKEQNESINKKIIFENLSDVKEKRGIKILSYGNFSTGKTHFALTGEKPIYIIDTENGASPLAEKFPDAKMLNICNMDGYSIDEKDEVENFQNFQEAIDYLCSFPDKELGTIVIDSISDIWTWSQAYAKTKIFKIPIEERFKQQFDWAVPSGMIRKNIQKLINKNCNVILTARADEIYEAAGKPIGRFKPNVQKKVPYMVDVVLFHEKRFINKQLQFQAKVEKCRQNEKIIGKVIENPSLNEIMKLIENE